MQITRKRRTRVPAVAAQLLLGIAGLALITLVCFRLGIGLARTGFAYVIMVALVSLLGSFSASVVLSIVAAACLNYFFAAPLFAFRIDVPEKTGKAVSAVSAKRVSVLALGLDEYKRWADQVERGFLLAAKFLRKECLYAARDLPYRTQIVPLAAKFGLDQSRSLHLRDSVFVRLPRANFEHRYVLSSHSDTHFLLAQ